RRDALSGQRHFRCSISANGIPRWGLLGRVLWLAATVSAGTVSDARSGHGPGLRLQLRADHRRGRRTAGPCPHGAGEGLCTGRFAAGTDLPGRVLRHLARPGDTWTTVARIVR